MYEYDIKILYICIFICGVIYTCVLEGFIAFEEEPQNKTGL